jgi:hypothetical protein
VAAGELELALVERALTEAALAVGMGEEEVTGRPGHRGTC